MRIRVEDDKRVHLVRIQELHDAAFEILEGFPVRVERVGNIVVDDHGALRAVLEMAMVAHRMDGTVCILAAQLLAVDDLVAATFEFRELGSPGRNVDGIFRVNVPVHVRVEKADDVFSRGTGNMQAHKPVRNEDCPDAAAGKLVDG